MTQTADVRQREVLGLRDVIHEAVLSHGEWCCTCDDATRTVGTSGVLEIRLEAVNGGLRYTRPERRFLNLLSLVGQRINVHRDDAAAGPPVLAAYWRRPGPDDESPVAKRQRLTDRLTSRSGRAAIIGIAVATVITEVVCVVLREFP
ncbi:hypothetical protein [Streptomyces sp. V1I1]|uniref:hypothetical protein n=1 Tax=Streptomyces sp. V1I1 TaxID=3042272 RepID=UPI0027D7ECE2|nr:hypothetical protein [Streptomyces sp. V1I1]